MSILILIIFTVIYNDMCFKDSFRKIPTFSRNTPSSLGCEQRAMLVPASAEYFRCGLPQPHCDRAMRFAFRPPLCRSFLSPSPTQNIPMGFGLENMGDNLLVCTTAAIINVILKNTRKLRIFPALWYLKLPRRQNSVKYSRADSRVMMWRFFDVSANNSIPIFRVCW